MSPPRVRQRGGLAGDQRTQPRWPGIRTASAPSTNGRVVESNFHDFPLPTMAEMPKMEAVLVPRGDFRGSHGEPVILPLAPAVRNAVSRAAGTRIRPLPL